MEPEIINAIINGVELGVDRDHGDRLYLRIGCSFNFASHQDCMIYLAEVHNTAEALIELRNRLAKRIARSAAANSRRTTIAPDGDVGRAG